MTLWTLVNVGHYGGGGDDEWDEVTLGSTPTAGNILFLICAGRGQYELVVPAGWASIAHYTHPTAASGDLNVIARVSDGTESVVTFVNTSHQAPQSLVYVEASGPAGVPAVDASAANVFTNTSAPAVPSLSPTAGHDLELWAILWKQPGGPSGGISVAGYTTLSDDGPPGSGNRHRLTLHELSITGSAGSYSPGNVTTGAAGDDGILAHLAFDLGVSVPPDTADPPSVLPEKEDDPAAAILEVYVVEETAARWDVALWDDSYAWAEGGWRDITPQGVVADIHWGSDQANLGILAPSRAAVWTITTYDPERVLDPANPDGPAYPQIVPFLPIRLRHRAATIRTGYVEAISYDYATGTGLIRGTDNIGRMSAADVPPDQVPFLATQLHARARDAIAAAGLDVDVPFGNAPWGAVELAPLEDGEYTVWQIVALSAEEALYVAYLDKDDRLRFRPYAFPIDRGTRVAADELVGLTVAMDHEGLYSAVALTDYSDASTDIVRVITPTPAYGKRVYSRSELTIEGAAWADAVLADRGAPSVRLIPGRIRPASATRVEVFAKLAPMETVQIAHEYAVPNVEAQGRLLGARIRVESHGPERLDWQWWLDTAAAGVGPLIADYFGNLPPLDYLVDDATGEYLYPDGVLVTEAL